MKSACRGILTLGLLAIVLVAAVDAQTRLPNIVIIYADDLGYGDLAVQNPQPKIPTPKLDRLASEGMLYGRTVRPAFARRVATHCLKVVIIGGSSMAS